MLRAQNEKSDILCALIESAKATKNCISKSKQVCHRKSSIPCMSLAPLGEMIVPQSHPYRHIGCFFHFLSSFLLSFIPLMMCHFILLPKYKEEASREGEIWLQGSRRYLE